MKTDKRMIKKEVYIVGVAGVFLLLLSMISAARIPTEIMRVNKIVDEFQGNENSTLMIQLESDLSLGDPEVSVTESVEINNNSLLGEERDLTLTVIEGDAYSVMSCGVANGHFNLATGVFAHGYTTLQYDGKDASDSINPTGLGGVSLIEGGSNAFQLNTISDHDTEYSIRIYSSANAFSEYKGIIPKNLKKPLAVYAKFAAFEGTADFSNVGAIEITIFGFVNVDVVITGFTIGKVKTLFANDVGDDEDYYDFDAKCAISSEEYEELYPEYYPECDDSETMIYSKSSSNEYSDFISNSFSKLLGLLSYAFTSLNFGVTSGGGLDISADGGNTLMDVIDVTGSELEEVLSYYFTSNNFRITSDGNMIVYPEYNNSGNSLIPSIWSSLILLSVTVIWSLL